MMGAARHGEQQVSTGIHARRDPAANLEILARTRVRGSVVVNQRQGPSGFGRRRREAAELSRQPEAHAAFMFWVRVVVTVVGFCGS